MSNATLPNGSFYYFLRLPGPAGLGHMGWGFETAVELRTCAPQAGPSLVDQPVMSAAPTYTPQWYFGSLENTGGSGLVMPDAESNENDYWTSVADSEAQMLYEMRTMETATLLLGKGMTGYSSYKKIPVSNADPVAAEALAAQWAGYLVTFNNCLDNAAKIGDAYRVPVWSWSRHVSQNLAPRRYFFDTLWQYNHEPV